MRRLCTYRRRWQLQYGSALAFAQPGYQYDPAIGELERIVMLVRPGHIDAAEASDLRAGAPKAE
jgi:hypothetical protein